MSSDTPWQSPSGPEDSGTAPAEPRFGAYGTPPAGQPSTSSPSYGPADPQVGVPPTYPAYPGAAHQAPPSFFVAPKPGIIPLRPLSITEIIGGAFESLRANPKAMFVPSIVVMSIIGLISAIPTFFTTRGLYSSLESTGDSAFLTEDQAMSLALDSLSTLGSSMLTAALTALASTILTGLLIVAVSRSVLGRVASPGEVWQRTKGRVWALIGQSILVSLIVGAASVVIALVGLVLFGITLVPVLNGDEPSGAMVAIAVIGILVLAVIGIILGTFLSVRLSLSSATLVLENVGVIEGIKRSWVLTRSYFWHVLGALLLAGIITVLVTGVLSGVTGAVAGVLSVTSGGIMPALDAVSTFIGSLLGALILPFSAAVTALIYIDLRMRQEGLDVELRQAADTL
ncbi:MULTISPECIES: glycerophosphodiester phosphodiesterase [Actinomyces]|uniref:Glycerophosphodiester phosphodiesterase n=1 Tax=Actinomyces respiraculi TaxID=2744574 RepID=A0A7T0LL86_9ACTO|nr:MULTISPECIES: glycerophosphodiester phosphodiesterase [Actinomyces]QPL05849.1 glycerophosphodiester phosphodiesterase [Actinomyces respiraculi]